MFKLKHFVEFWSLFCAAYQWYAREFDLISLLISTLSWFNYFTSIIKSKFHSTSNIFLKELCPPWACEWREEGPSSLGLQPWVTSLPVQMCIILYLFTFVFTLLYSLFFSILMGMSQFSFMLLCHYEMKKKTFLTILLLHP